MTIRKAQFPDAKVLVVDDDSVGADLLKQTMSNAGYGHIRILNDPRDVVEILQADDVDIILLDLNMPYLDGFDILRLLRDDPAHKYLPVLVITGKNERAVRLQALELGAKDFISKPYDLNELLNRIHNALEIRVLQKQLIDRNKELIQREADLRIVLDNVVEGIIVFDSLGTIQSVNIAAQNLFGFSADEVLGASVDVLIPSKTETLAELLRCDDQQGVRNEEVSGVRCDGTTFPLELSTGEVLGGGGKFFVTICRDITDRRLSDAANLLAKEELEQRIQARTAALTAANSRLVHEVDIRKKAQKELSSARDKAVENSKLKSQFLANVSHEIRTPLNGILGMLSLLLNSRIDGEQQDYALTAFKSGEILLALINNILDFSKIESGRLELEYIGYDARQLIYDVIHLYDEPSRKKGVDVVILAAPEVPEMLIGDPGRLRQVITNLVGNALKFTEKGEVTVELKATSFPGGGYQLCVNVRDTGVGIPASALDKIFESFTQADGSTTRKYGGTGLGLSICRQLVEMMGGKLGVESEIGKGSNFWFTVPQGLYQENASSVPMNLDLGQLRVLIVSDGAAQVSGLDQHLMKLGISFEKCGDPAHGLSVLRQAKRNGKPFDVVLVNSAGMVEEGLAFVRSLYANFPASELKVAIIALSGLRGFSRSAKEAGVRAYITEPINQRMVENCLASLLKSDHTSSTLITRHSLAEKAAVFKARILVVEDNVVNQKVAAKMLSKLGARVDIANDGRTALDALKNTRYDIVFMDCFMPDMDGFETTRQIRLQEAQNDSSAAPLTIVAMTANARQEDRSKCIAAGMNDFVSKPVTLETMRAVLSTWLSADTDKAE